MVATDSKGDVRAIKKVAIFKSVESCTGGSGVKGLTNKQQQTYTYPKLAISILTISKGFNNKQTTANKLILTLKLAIGILQF